MHHIIQILTVSKIGKWTGIHKVVSNWIYLQQQQKHKIKVTKQALSIYIKDVSGCLHDSAVRLT